MDYLGAWLSWSPVPTMPLAALKQWNLALAWALVLAWLSLLLVQRFLPTVSRARRLFLAAACFIGVALPWAASPAYWLGLAFQAPSLLAAAIAARGIWTQLGLSQPRNSTNRASAQNTLGLCFVGVLLGWALLLDTLGFWPRSVYALGFGWGALAAVALLGAVWAWRRPQPSAWLLCAVVLVFALARLPTGNLWDALLDPWLWLALHAKLLHGLIRIARAR